MQKQVEQVLIPFFSFIYIFLTSKNSQHVDNDVKNLIQGVGANH
jgi:hypothetical protein